MPELKPKPCPVCNRQPDVDLCDPWKKQWGPQPWYAGCYSNNPKEHYIGGNGDTRKEAIAVWEAERNKYIADRTVNA